jgi:hypothetical protein
LNDDTKSLGGLFALQQPASSVYLCFRFQTSSFLLFQSLRALQFSFLRLSSTSGFSPFPPSIWSVLVAQRLKSPALYSFLAPAACLSLRAIRVTESPDPRIWGSSTTHTNIVIRGEELGSLGTLALVDKQGFGLTRIKYYSRPSNKQLGEESFVLNRSQRTLNQTTHPPNKGVASAKSNLDRDIFILLALTIATTTDARSQNEEGRRNEFLKKKGIDPGTCSEDSLFLLRASLHFSLRDLLRFFCLTKTTRPHTSPSSLFLSLFDKRVFFFSPAMRGPSIQLVAAEAASAALICQPPATEGGRVTL